MAHAVTKAELEAFRSAYAGLSGTEVRTKVTNEKEFRDEIEHLYVGVYHLPLNKACTECWVDGFVLLMRGDVDKLFEQSKRQFELKAGALLMDSIGHRKELHVSHHNLTDDLALYHLATRPQNITQFSKAPDNWRELALAAYNPDGTPNTTKTPAKTDVSDSKDENPTTTTADLNEARSKAKKKVSAAKGKVTAAEKRGDAAAVEKAKQALAKAEAELAKLAEQE